MADIYLVLNAGSSSLKFSIFEETGAPDPTNLYRGQIEGIGTSPRMIARAADGTVVAERRWSADEPLDREAALLRLIEWIDQRFGSSSLLACGHRVVHGGLWFDRALRVDAEALEKLARLSPLAPLHQPVNLDPIRILNGRLPALPQVACFDTAFHRQQPEVAQRFAVPEEMTARGMQRYGFHGLSYDYVASVLGEHDASLPKARVVIAHLGSGASMCALQAGRSVATTMGFSALDGLPMGTRCGSLDPAAVFFMLREFKMSPDEAERVLYNKSGLLGVSGISNDMRVLRERASTEPKARLAIDLFVYRIGRELGSLTAALGGIDALVFTGGIGENDVATRAEVLTAAAWAGFVLDADANAAGGPRVSRGDGPSAWVIPTNEELTIARQTRAALAAPTKKD